MGTGRWEKLAGNHRVDEYKWEFLRRNEDYQLDYAAFANQFPEWVKGYGVGIPLDRLKQSGPEEWAFLHNKVYPAVWKLSERWYIRDLIDPLRSSNEASPFFYSESWMREQHSEEGPESDEPPTWDYFSHILGDAPHTPKGLRFIMVPIDIAQPIKRTFAALEVHIEIARSRYRLHIGPLPDSRKRPRARLEEYGSYLMVWDLRRQNLTFEQIAFQLFPREMKNMNSRSAMTKRMRSHFQRAQKLINGEYRQIEG